MMSFLSFFVGLLGLAYLIGTLSDDDKTNIKFAEDPDGVKGSIAGDALYTIGCGVRKCNCYYGFRLDSGCSSLVYLSRIEMSDSLIDFLTYGRYKHYRSK